MSRLALIVAITIAAAIFSHAQREAPSVVGAQKFVSLQGRFSISLPERTGYGPLTIPTPFGNAQGAIFQWQTKEATFGVGYADASQPLEDPETAKQFFNGAAELFKKLATTNSGNVAAVRQITLEEYPGIEQRADLFTGSIIQRTYIVSRRIYEMVAVVKNNQREYESVAVGALDSFKLLSDAEIALRRSEEAAKAEPGPLPQRPIARRDGTDVSDEGLRGPVKSVLVEREDLSGTWAVQGRKRESFNSYDAHGNKLRTELYSPEGILDQITVYGFIDGSRVADFKWLPRENSPPAASGVSLGPGGVAPGGVVKKSDPLYQNRFEFKYDDKKRLKEKITFLSNGDISLRNVYKYNGNQTEEATYSADGSLRWRALFTLDSKGNKVSRTVFRRDGSVHVESFSYEFDSHGNWTKRTTSRIVKKDGRDEPTPYAVYYRTITYY